MTHHSINSAHVHPPFGAYSQAVVSGDLLMTSGQLAIAPDGTVPDGAYAQASYLFSALEHLLAAAGHGRADVLRLNAYVTERHYMAEYMRARDEWVQGLAVLPASTLMVVSGFTRPEFVVEIEATSRRCT